MLTGTLSAPDPAVGHSHPHTSTSCTLTGKSGSVIAPFSESWCAQGLVCALQESVSPVLCKFWQLYDGVNGDLLQEGLCHTQVCRTLSLCPCSRPLLIHTFSGDIQTQFWLSFCGVSGSWCAQGLFEPSKCLGQVWGLNLKVISPLLPSFWGLSLDPTFCCQQLFSSKL